MTDAEGATAPETLRHKNRKGQDTLERGAQAPADGITLSGIQDRGGIIVSANRAGSRMPLMLTRFVHVVCAHPRSDAGEMPLDNFRVAV